MNKDYYDSMKKIFFIITAIVLSLTITNSALAKEKVLENFIKNTINNQISQLAQEPIIVNAVTEANIKADKSLAEIMQLDQKWRNADETDKWVSSFLDNRCANFLKNVQYDSAKGAKGIYAEIFLMDKQGNIVAESNMTSDYWQGDEDKFIKAFNEEKGAFFIDSPAFDESTEKYLIHFSVPVLDQKTKKAIGVITIGIDIDAFAARYIY